MGHVGGIRSLLRTQGTKIIALGFWLALIGLYQWYAALYSLTPWEMVRQFMIVLEHPLYGPLMYIIFYTLQPVIFFPSWLLTVAGGCVFGVAWGTLYTLIGSNLSSLVAYGVGWFFGQNVIARGDAHGLIARYAGRMRRSSFETVLVMRFLFLPYDIVSYLAGFLRIRWQPFLLATVLGSIPGTLAFVSFGASIEPDFAGQRMAMDPWTLALSVALFTASFVLWRMVKRIFLREQPVNE